MEKEFKSVIKNFMDALNEVLKHFDKKQKKALQLLLEPEFTELAKGQNAETIKTLAYGYLCSKDIIWEHKAFEYPNEFEQVWKVYYWE